MPEEKCYIGAFENIIQELQERKFIKKIPGDEACFIIDSRGNKTIFPYRYEFNWNLLEENEYLSGSLNIHATFKPNRDTNQFFEHKRDYDLQITRGSGVDYTKSNTIYKNFVVITTYTHLENKKLL